MCIEVYNCYRYHNIETLGAVRNCVSRISKRGEYNGKYCFRNWILRVQRFSVTFIRLSFSPRTEKRTRGRTIGVGWQDTYSDLTHWNEQTRTENTNVSHLSPQLYFHQERKLFYEGIFFNLWDFSSELFIGV